MDEGERDAGEPRYTAFLSYSHKDAAAAGRLHRKLETYRIPRRLVGTETARGRVAERLWPIFRDRDELPAATDLSETVREALAQSGALIILCSPQSSGSLWVAEEIEVFRRLHPDRPILAAILEGDPPDCFPEKLRAFGQDGTWHEPLATDLRPQGDGAHLGLLKLVAGITGLGLDALVQRDAARKVRRVMAVTTIALAAMLIMAALALVALDARREAERRRAEATGLIEFMLTDLRTELRGVGRLDVMSTVNRRALSYYEQRAQARSPADLAMHARVMHAIGEGYLERGDIRSAMPWIEQALQATTSLIAESPNDPDILFAHAQSEYWAGRVHELTRNWPEVRPRYARYAALAKRLIEIEPDNPDYMLEMAWGASNRGVIERDADGNNAAAQRSFEVAARWFERALRSRHRDSDARDLANLYGDLADTYYNREMWRDALAVRLRQYRFITPLQRANPANVELRYRLATSERAAGRAAALAGDRDSARRFMLSAHERMRALTDHDPQNAEWRMFRAKVECELLSPTLAIRSGIPAAALRRSVADAVEALSAQRNPSVSELERCRAW